MKMTKRAICLLLAAVMALALTIPVIAAEDTGGDSGSPRTIKLDPGAGTLKDGVYEVTATDNKLPALPTPEREGWTFEGWYTSEVTETFDNKPLQPGSNEANTHYYQWTISTDGSEVKAGDPFPEVSTLYAKYAPTNVTYKLHASGWRNYFGTLTVTRQYGVPFDPYVFPWNASLESDRNTVKEIYFWTGENGDTFTLDGWYTALNGGNNITGGIDNKGNILAGGTTVGSFGNNVDLYLHWKSETYPEINQTTASTSYRADARASYVEFPQEQRKVVHIHEGESFTLNAYTTPKDAYPLNVNWSSDPEGVVTIEPNEGTTTAKVTGNKYGQDGKEPRTANVTITLTGKDGKDVTRTMTVAVGHNFNTYVSSWGGNCTKEGYIQWKCSLPYCSAYYTEHTPETHVFSNPITYPATCTAKGYTIQKCTRCGKELKTNEVPELGHSFDITTEKGCSGTVTIKTCTVCGYVETVEDTSTAQHAWQSDHTVDKEPTCAAEGSQSIHCDKCGAIKDSKPIPATGNHSFGDWKTVTEASWDHEGLRERECTVCHAKESEVISKRPNYPIGGGGGGSATPSPSPSASPEPSPSESPSPSPEPGTTPEPGVTPAPSPVPVPVDPPKTNEGSGWSYDYDTGDYYYFVEGEPKANYWAKDETASQWGFWYYVGSDGKLATGLQYIENNNGTGWYFLQPGNDDGCVGKMLTGWQWLGPEAGEGWFSTAHGGKNGQCTWTENWGDYDPATGLWEDGLSHK